MPSFEWNKIIASILTALIVAMVSGILAEELYRTEKPAKPVFEVAGAPSAAPAEKAAPSGQKSIAALLAKADVKKGQQLTAVCQACHTFTKGGANGLGPNLYGIFGDEIAEDRHHFEFSEALEKHKGVWTPDLLNEWLTDPQKFAPGTKMSFAGIKNEKQRIDVIAYLQSLGGKPIAAAAAPSKVAPSGEQAFAALLAKADPKKGEQLTAVCQACHTFTKGGANGLGPNLFGVVGAEIGEDRNHFEFSEAIEKHKGRWTPALLNEWLTDPQKFAPGTKMTFAGIKNEQQRADVIAYLQSLK
jgi:cytochrome c